MFCPESRVLAECQECEERERDTDACQKHVYVKPLRTAVNRALESVSRERICLRSSKCISLLPSGVVTT